jgi:hypothetical protein
LKCPECGAENPANNTFCNQCGREVLSVPRGGIGDTVEDTLAWSRVVPLATNPVVIKDLFLVLFVPALLAGILFTIIVGDVAMLLLFLGLAVGLFVLGFVIMTVLQLGTKGGLNTFFYIGSEGVAYKAGKETKILNRVATAGSFAMGSAAGTGSGLLAISEEANTLFWEDVRYVTVNTGMKMILFRSPALISPIPLYCTDENFPAVVGMIRKYAPSSAKITTK